MPEQCAEHMRWHCSEHMHVRTYVRTNEELLTFRACSYVSNARGGAAKNG